MADPLLLAQGIGKRFGGFVALDGIDLAVKPGERLGLLGPNGSGKSTLVNCLTGALAHDRGTIHFRGERLDGLAPHRRIRAGLARTFQVPRPFAQMTVRENLDVPLLYAGPTPRSLSEAASALLDEVGLAGKADAPADRLTQVELRKLELARAMAARPRLLFADEAMAGLSTSEVEEILALLLRLNAAGVAIVMIEHIMHAVTRFAERLVVLVAGRKIADGDPAAVLADPAVEKAYLGE
jgi:branched-chain amino acid transport system ATP-binding protein